MQNIILSYFSVLIGLIITFFVGGILRYPFNATSFALSSRGVFKNILFGLVTVVMAYSLWITKGFSVSWMYLFLGISYLLYFKFAIKNENLVLKVTDPKYSILGLTSLILIITFAFISIYLLTIFNFKTQELSNTYCDWFYYSKTIQYLNLGFENTFQFNNFLSNSHLVSPYHYFDLWVAAILCKISGIPPQIAVNILMPTFFGVLYILGIIGLSKKRNIKTIFFACLIAFLSYYPYSLIAKSLLSHIGISSYFSSTIGIAQSVIGTPKLYVFALMFCLFIYQVIEKKYFKALLALLIIPITTVAAIPSFMFGIAFSLLFLIIYYLKNHKEDLYLKSEIISSVLLFGAFSILILIYKLIIWSNQDIASAFFIFTDFKTHFSFLIQPLIYITSYIPFIFIILILRNGLTIDQYALKFVGFIFAVIYSFAIIFGVLTVTNYNGYQLFMNVIVPLSNLSIAWLLVNITFEKRSVVWLISIVCLLVLPLYFAVKQLRTFKTKDAPIEYKHAVLNQFFNVKKPIYCAVIHSPDFYSKTYFNCFSTVFTYAYFIDSYQSGFYQVVISDFISENYYKKNFIGIELERDRALNGLKEGIFYKYVETQKSTHRFVSIEKSQIEFIHNFGISYIFISKQANVSEEMKSIISPIVSDVSSDSYTLYKILL